MSSARRCLRGVGMQTDRQTRFLTPRLLKLIQISPQHPKEYFVGFVPCAVVVCSNQEELNQQRGHRKRWYVHLQASFGEQFVKNSGEIRIFEKQLGERHPQVLLPSNVGPFLMSKS